MFTKFVNLLILNGSRPHNVVQSSLTFFGGMRGGRFLTFSAMALNYKQFALAALKITINIIKNFFT